jgi:putative membrane protein
VGGEPGHQAGTLMLVAVIFGIVNAILRPIIKILGCWAYVLTLGLVAVFVNGALLMLTDWIAGELGLDFNVDAFWPTAVLGALLIGVVSWVLNMLVPDSD